MHTFRRAPIWARLSLILLGLLLLALNTGARAADEAPPPTAGRGYVEEARVLPAERQLRLSGWAAPAHGGVFSTNLIVEVAGQRIYRGRFERAERPDVVAATGRTDWLWSGWAMTLALPRDVPAGAQPLSVSMRLGDGQVIALTNGTGVQRVEVPAVDTLSAAAALLAALGVAAPLAVLLLAGRDGRIGWRGRRLAGAPVFGGALVLAFACWVAAGLTGSSFLRALDASSAILTHDARHLLGQTRAIRSDEWLVSTPQSFAQAAHEPPFPVINRRIGPEGSNMLVVGHVGVPVAHVSSLARPVSWGFLALDARRGLAWAWWFPFLACFAALWGLLIRLFALDWRWAAALAACVAATPYAVGFSGWPAYAACFPLAGLIAADAALRASRPAAGLAWGAAAGWAAAGFALVLFPAWQIPMAWLAVALAAGWWWRDRAQLRWGAPQWLALAAALGVVGLLVGAWWLDAREAVALLRATVYPGGRSAEAGGDIEPWFLIKGLLSPVTQYNPHNPAMDQSDAGSVVLLLPALALAVGLAWRRAGRVDAVMAALCAFTLGILAFMFLGFPTWLARATLLGSATSYRMDFVLGLAQALLLGALLAQPVGVVQAWRDRPRLALLVVAALLAHAIWLLAKLPVPVAASLPEGFVALSLLALAAAMGLLLTGRLYALIVLLAAWTLGAALPFNPIGQGPTRLRLDAGLAAPELKAPDVAGRRGLAVLDAPAWAMTLPAAGLGVVNGVLYHPQFSLWRELDPNGTQRALYNRYQRLGFTLAAPGKVVGAEGFRIDSPRLDEVRVTIDPARFDFRRLGARHVIAPAALADRLAESKTLTRVAVGERGYALFAVRADSASQ